MENRIMKPKKKDKWKKNKVCQSTHKGIPEEEKGGLKNVLDEIMSGIFPNLKKETHIQV